MILVDTAEHQACRKKAHLIPAVCVLAGGRVASGVIFAGLEMNGLKTGTGR